MHKKLESDLMSLAHSILQMKNKDNVFLLKEKSKEIYEKLSVLAFVEEYMNSTPNLNVSKVDLIDKVKEAYKTKDSLVADNEVLEVKIKEEEKVVFNLIDEVSEPELKEEVLKNVVVEEIIEQPFDELEEIMASASDTATNFKNDVKDVGERKSVTLEEELQDTISVDVMADLFENAQPKSLNDKLAANIQIGLNDRIVFVLNLFNGKQEDYNRVVSQLNTFKSEKEAKNFINTMVKPDYNWSDHEELEIRFFEIIERKFA
ncbi:hypothetical protein [Polaribacter ponticola]|uniref:Uncharacterized protein n=1 Tax=Polaribacter ponticola TaxID=2978475 RepID=A0ABT5SCE5_9FLAO|nr:hypothetical protein [Polaribacter sp. MSW5]MDD7915808.1 hypothetical protein [Polaribacter sp. MSW5]